MTSSDEERTISEAENGGSVTEPTDSRDDHPVGTTTGTGAGATAGAVAGMILGGPVGAVVGGAIGGAVGGATGHTVAEAAKAEPSPKSPVEPGLPADDERR